jgi:hypothetical protein
MRTLTCLARRLSLASRLEHSNQTNYSRRWPSVPCFLWSPATSWPRNIKPCRPVLLEVGVGSVSPVPPRIAHPWIPKAEGVAGAISEDASGSAQSMLTFSAWTLRMLSYCSLVSLPVYRSPAGSPLAALLSPADRLSRNNLAQTARSSRFARNLLTISSRPRRVKPQTVKILADRPQFLLRAI